MTKSIKDGIATEYTYNESGYRIQKSIDGEVTDYYYENELLIAEKSDSNTIWYIYGAGEEKIGFIYNGETYYYEQNAMGDIINILDSAGTVAVTYTYDAWGNIISVTGDKTLADVNPIRYRGYYYDRETGLYNLNTRYYNPEIGRFMSLDEPETLINSADNYNLYAYCCNNPVNYYDPDGREKVAVNVMIYVDYDIYNCEEGHKDEYIKLNAEAYFDDAQHYVNNAGGSVTINTITKSGFKNSWNRLKSKDVDVLTIIAHGEPEYFWICGEKFVFSDFEDLNTIKLDLLVLTMCNAGHYDSYKTNKERNIAYLFYDLIDNSEGNGKNTSMVLASDGTVYDYGSKYFYSSPDVEWYILAVNGYSSNRKYNYGWILLRHGYNNEWNSYNKTMVEGKVQEIYNGEKYLCEGIDFSATIGCLVANYGLFSYK